MIYAVIMTVRIIRSSKYYESVTRWLGIYYHKLYYEENYINSYIKKVDGDDVNPRRSGVNMKNCPSGITNPRTVPTDKNSISQRLDVTAIYYYI